MASRIMHLAVAKLVSERLGFIDNSTFYLGNLAPDLSHYGEGNYEDSHFARIKDDYKGIEFASFVRKYDGRIKSCDFLLGYFVHLMTDAIWLNNIQQVFVRQYSEKKDELYKSGYQDMRNYNQVLIEDFNLEMISNVVVTNDIEEVDTRLIEALFTDLEKDFLTSKGSREGFLVYPYKSVIDFIHKTVDHAATSILRIKSNEPFDDPYQYFVPIGHDET